MRFYLGTHQPSWLARDLGVPLLVSHRRLAGRRTLPRATGPFAVDSGGFSELSLYGRWRTDERSYVAALRRYATEIGQMDWAAPMDWMTESHVLARTGLSLRTHQQRTVANHLRLRDLAPELPIIAVLQGQSVADFHRCADLYERHGVDLAALPLVGVGSICRRQQSADIEQILRSLAARGYRLHAFGAKVLGLGRYADTISSSDSAAWSYRGRFVPGCSPSHRSESNCLRFALSWHARLLATLRADAPEHGPDHRDGRRPHGRPPSRHRNRTRARDTRPTGTRPFVGERTTPATGRRFPHNTHERFRVAAWHRTENPAMSPTCTYDKPDDGTSHTATGHGSSTKCDTAEGGVNAGVEGDGGVGPRLYTPADAAELLTVRESWLRRQAGQRRIPCTLIGRHLRFSRRDVDAIIAAGARPAKPARRRPRARRT